MNAENIIAPPETGALVELHGDQDAPGGIYSGFVGENANYFAQAFASLNEVFCNEGSMTIVSDEVDYTVAVAVRKAGGDASYEEGVVDVDCAILEAEQDSLADCLKALDAVDKLV